MIIILLQFGSLNQEKSAENRKMPFLATESIHMPFPNFASSFFETNALTFNVLMYLAPQCNVQLDIMVNNRNHQLQL